MNEWVSLIVNVVIGSVIGGVTNELAIRMLFRPYKPWMIGRLRVPFTPGLIPRRRDEIGVQMGRLVEHHLLTVEGVKKALAQSGLESIQGHYAEFGIDLGVDTRGHIWLLEVNSKPSKSTTAVQQPGDEEGEHTPSRPRPSVIRMLDYAAFLSGFPLPRDKEKKANAAKKRKRKRR